MNRLFIVPVVLYNFSASFYGNSYISVPFIEAKSTTSIEFKFRTRLPNALLLLVSGQQDYCVVKLENSLLKVIINLGGGETELTTPKSLILNDFKWHKIIINRKEANLTIIVDNTHSVRKKLPGKFFELNIQSGLFVGDLGNDTNTFFGHHINFRGCMEQLVYNGFQILDLARRRMSQAIVHGVTWNCASEFEANANRPVSFIEDGAFMLIPRNVSSNLRLQAEIKTIQDHSILFYNSGLPTRSDHFAVEIWEGKIKVTIKRGALIIENQNNAFVSDGKWHKFTIKVTPSSVDITVNNSVTSSVIPRGYFIDFDKVFYVGGLELSKKARANSKDLKTTDSNYKGCMRHIMFGEKKTGLPDAYVTSGLYPGCLWDYSSDKSSCFQDGVDCFNDTFDYNYMNLAEKLELLTVEPLKVLESGIVRINVTNLHVIVDFPKYNILDTGVIFNITESPAYGVVSNNVNYKEITSFTLNDLFNEKVFYKHDGSEHFKDGIVMDLVFTSENMVLPLYLQGKFKFTLYVQIEPVNDAPELRIRTGSSFTLAQVYCMPCII